MGRPVLSQDGQIRAEPSASGCLARGESPEAAIRFFTDHLGLPSPSTFSKRKNGGKAIARPGPHSASKHRLFV